MQRTFWYELKDMTQNNVKFTQRTRKRGEPFGDTQAQSLRDGELGYLYVKKALWLEFGQPLVLKITVAVDTEPDEPFPEFN